MLAWQKKYAPLLYPFSWAYAGLMALRRARLASRGLALPVPVVSVGNISWGGTGKSPMVDWLLTWAERRQLSAVVLTRGYKARPPHLPFIVSPSHSPAECGDEPLMLAVKHPSAHIVVDPVRVRAAAHAMRLFSPQLVILDDGFQHLAMARNHNLVLLAPEDLEQDWNRVIPAGTWRESACALSFAHAFLIKLDNPSQWAELRPLAEKRLAPFPCPIFPFTLEVTSLSPVLPLSEHASSFAPADTPRIGQPYRLITGIGRPDQARATITRFMGCPPAEHHIFSDHHIFSPLDLAPFFPGASKGGLPLVCTTKDAPKLQSIPHIHAMHAEPSFLGPFPAWWQHCFYDGERLPHTPPAGA